MFSHTINSIQLSCGCFQTRTHTHGFGDLLVQMRPWEYLHHHSTQIKAVNRDPGGREESKNIFLLFLLTMTCVCVLGDKLM